MIRPHAHRSGFTLLELLIVISIIAVLAGMTLSVVVMIREQAKVSATHARMQTIINGLASYAAQEGSIAISLQTALGLGGVHQFASVKVINDSVGAGCAKPPPFRSWQKQNYGDASQPQWPAGGFWPAGWTDLDATNYGATPERRTLWRRLIDEVFDVMPPTGSTWTVADYLDADKGGWPTQWPETDWNAAVPGTRPPILRFPWGKPGLRIDATVCDPGADATATDAVFSEWAASGGQRTTATEPVHNRWVTTGAPLTGAIWTWTCTDPAQTDATTLTAATRSDGSAVPNLSATMNSNQPLPFDAGYMSPLASVRLLQAAGVVPPGDAGAEQYRTNRTTSMGWNDAWGNPIVVVYAMYQPERYLRTFDGQNRRDLLLRGSNQAYQYNRSLYFAAGALGGDLRAGLSRTWAAADDATTLRDFWRQIREVAGAADWTEASFSAPAWKGVRSRKSGGQKCHLTSPIEVK